MDIFNNNSQGGDTLPRQRLSIKEKGKEWGKSCINFYSNYRYTNGSSIRSDRFRKLINYDLYNAKINYNDVESICNPLGLADSSWANRFQHYDVISEAIRFLEGEEAKRVDNFMVVSESPDDISRKQDNMKNQIMEQLNATLTAGIDPSTIDPNNPPPTPEQLIKYRNYSISDLIEAKANKLLKNIRKRLNLKQIFSLGWKDALISGEEIYWCGILNDEPILRRVNPVNLTVILDDDTQYIDDAVAVIEERYLTISSIMDEYGDELSQDDLDAIEKYTRGTYGNFGTAGGYTPQFEIQNGKLGFSGITPTPGFNGNNVNNYSIRVCRVEWLSMQKVGILNYTDEDGIPQTEDIDENFNLKIFKEQYPDAKVEWYWINQAWEGVKIGMDVYIGIRPKPNQRRRMDNPYYARLGYTGFIYSATNSQSISLVDRLKPYQYLYDIIMYRLELAFASDQGKVFLMDLAQIPQTEGIDVEKWIYYLKEMKIGFINSFEEGKKGASIGQLSKFNQFQAIDLSLAQSIQQYINYLEYIKNQIYFVSGITPQRLGAISSQELVGNVEKAINQSALITEYLFEAHDEVKRRAYTAILEVAKIAYREGHKTQYVLDDMGIELLNILPLEFENSEFNVFMSNTSKDNQIKQEVKMLFNEALKMDKVDLSTIVETLLNDDTKNMVHILKDAEAKFYERKQQEQQSALEHEKQLHDENLNLETRRLDLEQYKIDQDNKTKIEVAEIATYNRQENLDLNQNNIPDPMEIANNALKQQEINSKAFLEQQKLNHDRLSKEKEISFKEKELKIKEDLEKEKLKVERENMRNDEKIARINAKNRSKKK